MSDRYHQEKKNKLSYRLSRFIQRYRVFFLIVGAVVILFPIGYYVVDAIRQSNNEASAVQNEKLNEKWDEYDQEQDATKKDALEKELLDIIQESADRFPDKFAGIQALFLRADLNLVKLGEGSADKKKELYISIIKDWMNIADKAEGNILTPQALMDAAAEIQNATTVLSEEAAVKTEEIRAVIPGKIKDAQPEKPASRADIALMLYRYIVDRYPHSLYIPEALINMGFILEDKKNYKEAGDIYNRLESEFASSNWTKIAINRKIDLETKGVISN